MRPAELQAASFAQYPPEGAAAARAHLVTLREMPLALLPVTLRELIGFDWRFPAERRQVLRQLNYLGGLTPERRTAALAPFAALRLPAELAQIDWVNQPEAFIEALTAALWSSHQMDAYRAAAQQHQAEMDRAAPEPPPATERLGVAIIGQGVATASLPLFRKLRPHGVLFTRLEPQDGVTDLLRALESRAAKHPEPYAHWYIEGGAPAPGYAGAPGLAIASYAELGPMATSELERVTAFIQQQRGRGVNAERVRSYMASLRPEDLQLSGGMDPVMRHFALSVLTEGAGAQIFSTTFVQWTAREALRRAQPLTLVARFAPRQQMAPMNELLARDPMRQPVDAEGSLVDADMGAYYTWINLQRLPGAETTRFLAWFEGHGTALAIAPTLPRGAVSEKPATLGKVLEWMS